VWTIWVCSSVRNVASVANLSSVRQALPLHTNLARGQQTPAVGQDPVCAPVQLEHVVEVSWVDLEFAGVNRTAEAGDYTGVRAGGRPTVV
jgi:hypothetical protein